MADEEAGVPWDWRTFGEYLDRLDGTPACSDSRGMPSTRASMRMRKSASLDSSGAIVNPQLPPTIVVTPCSDDGVRPGSQNACAS